MGRLPKPNGCVECPGYEWVHPIPNTKRFTEPRCGFSNAEGAGTSGVHMIGEALGQNEDTDGLPFRPQAQAGSLLQRALQRLGYNRDMFRIHNIVRCRPPHDLLSDTSYEFDVIQHCRPYLLNELAAMRPRCILALGGTAARELTGLSGKAAGVTYTRGYVLPCCLKGYEDVPVVATYHPSFLRQGKPQFFGILCADIKRAVDTARISGKFEEVQCA